MIVLVIICLLVVLLATLIGGVYIYEDIDWYTEPPRTEIEIKAQDIKARIAWIKLDMAAFLQNTS
jgi:hypothetical protein